MAIASEFLAERLERRLKWYRDQQLEQTKQYISFSTEKLMKRTDAVRDYLATILELLAIIFVFLLTQSWKIAFGLVVLAGLNAWVRWQSRRKEIERLHSVRRNLRSLLRGWTLPAESEFDLANPIRMKLDELQHRLILQLGEDYRDEDIVDLADHFQDYERDSAATLASGAGFARFLKGLSVDDRVFVEDVRFIRACRDRALYPFIVEDEYGGHEQHDDARRIEKLREKYRHPTANPAGRPTGQ
ncbi:MAG: hypothetical protein ACRD4Q_08875 [Candidatus Acidiferrales bacterium]